MQPAAPEYGAQTSYVPQPWEPDASSTNYPGWGQSAAYPGAPIRSGGPANRHSRARWLAGLAATVVVAGVLTVRSGILSQSSGGARSATSRPTTSSNPAPATPAELGSTLAQIALQPGDLNTGYTVRLIPGGDQVIGQVTMDNCGFNFTTEAHRVARRQYEVLDPASADTGLSNELVAYDTPAQAAKAMTQWHTAAATCPRTPVRPSVAGEPAVRITVTQNLIDVSTLPATNNAVTAENAAIAGKGTLYNVAILQVHGRYLDAVYVSNGRPITSQDLAATMELAALTGQRLVAHG